MQAAGNSTLGFDSIQFVNLRSRYDRHDAMTLQAFLSGLDIVESPGVEAHEIHDVGMPPSHTPGYLTDKEKGCYRAHANIWSDMLKKNQPAVLIVESDAAWDVNVRDIMANFNKHFIQFLRQIGSTPIKNPVRAARASGGAQAKQRIEYNPQDPWLSRHWDVLSLGHCLEMPQHRDVFRAFPDAHVPAGMDYWGTTLGHDRVVRKSGGAVCLTGYAISQTGAAKLLLRTAVDFDDAADLIMRRMILAGDLIAYSVFPTIMSQWQYAEGIGMDQRGADSDIRGNGHALEKNTVMKGWDDVWKSGSAWEPKKGHPDIAFQEMALSGAWNRIFGKAPLKASTVKTRMDF
ncbi:hypothetical protein CDD83_2509 [Cordyceps sp. RAO-2017]|nr:hypothetical protein CDD83_2509 [Cordyceps sp. RAO-2017]